MVTTDTQPTMTVVSDPPLQGTPGAIRLDQKSETDETEYTNYILTWPESGKYQTGEFYMVTDREWDEISTRKGQLTYLQLPEEYAGLIHSFVFRRIGATNGIEDINIGIKAKDEDAWFNMQGQRVATPSHGIYIHNGKKVVVK